MHGAVKMKLGFVTLLSEFIRSLLWFDGDDFLQCVFLADRYVPSKLFLLTRRT